jgi:hypothetical protein
MRSAAAQADYPHSGHQSMDLWRINLLSGMQ